MAIRQSSSEFNRRVWAVVEQIPPGRVCTYGRVADLAGYPRHARMVARALQAAPTSDDLPWHRVIAAGGRIALLEGSTHWQQQIRRLKGEGVKIEQGRVDWLRHAWQGELDALLWHPAHLNEGREAEHD